MTHDKMIAVIEHHKNGGKVEYKSKDGSLWRITKKPMWDFDLCDYRAAKPEPLAIWAEIIGNGHIARYTSTESKPCMGGVMKKFVEVEARFPSDV